MIENERQYEEAIIELEALYDELRMADGAFERALLEEDIAKINAEMSAYDAAFMDHDEYRPTDKEVRDAEAEE